jgi:hypothetical protein
MKDNTMKVEEPKGVAVKKVQPSKEDVFALGSTMLNKTQYPQLKDVQEGSEVSGTWKGKVSSVDEESCEVGFTEMDVETENSADQALKAMMGQGGGGQGSGPKSSVQANGDEEDI